MIARTLGVVETTRASTVDSARVPVYVYADADAGEHSTPESELEQRGAAVGEESRIQEPPAPALDTRTEAAPDTGSSRTIDEGPNSGQEQRPGSQPLVASDIDSQRLAKPRLELTLPGACQGAIITSVEPEACFFSPSDEKNLELSGALLSSPAMSRQGSPVLERRRLQPLRGDMEVDANSSGASSDSEPFTILCRSPEADVIVGEGLGLSGGASSAYLGPALRRRGGTPSTSIHAEGDAVSTS